jgi:hypothetical protein
MTSEHQRCLERIAMSIYRIKQPYSDQLSKLRLMIKIKTCHSDYRWWITMQTLIKKEHEPYS